MVTGLIDFSWMQQGLYIILSSPGICLDAIDLLLAFMVGAVSHSGLFSMHLRTLTRTYLSSRTYSLPWSSKVGLNFVGRVL